jgi:hypothetical protein
MDTTDIETIIPDEINNAVSKGLVNQEKDTEYFECQRCGEYNFVKNIPRNRRATSTRHIKINPVTWSSFKRYATINNVNADYALTMLLHNARTASINYLINSKSLTQKKSSG